MASVGPAAEANQSRRTGADESGRWTKSAASPFRLYAAAFRMAANGMGRREKENKVFYNILFVFVHRESFAAAQLYATCFLFRSSCDGIAYLFPLPPRNLIRAACINKQPRVFRAGGQAGRSLFAGNGHVRCSSAPVRCPSSARCPGLTAAALTEFEFLSSATFLRVPSTCCSNHPLGAVLHSPNLLLLRTRTDSIMSLVTDFRRDVTPIDRDAVRLQISSGSSAVFHFNPIFKRNCPTYCTFDVERKNFLKQSRAPTGEQLVLTAEELAEPRNQVKVKGEKLKI